MERRTAEEARSFAEMVKAKYATGAYTYSSLSRELDCSVQYVRNIILNRKVVRNDPPKGNRKRINLNGCAFYIYDDGRLWSCALNRFLKPKQCRDYKRITVIRDGVPTRYKVHRLVLTYFKRPPKAGEVGRHLDDDPTNNHISNLAWGSYQDNTDDMRRNGSMLFGEEVSAAKLTDDLVIKLRRDYKTGCNVLLYLSEFQRKYARNIESLRTLRLALFGHQWAHLPMCGVNPEDRHLSRYVSGEQCTAAHKQCQKLNNDSARRIHRNYIKYHSRYTSMDAFCKAFAAHLKKAYGIQVHHDSVCNVIKGKSFKHIYAEFYKE